MHWNILNAVQADMMDQVTERHGDSSATLVKRMGLMWYRIAMILSALRNHDSVLDNESLKCSDIDFSNAGILMNTYKEHILHVYQSLPKQEERKNPLKNRLWEKLPDSFDRTVLLDIGKLLGMPVRTIDGYRKDFQKDGILETIKQGSYRKVKK